MDDAKLDPTSPAAMDAGGRWTASAVVGTVVGRLAEEFPELPVGVILAASLRSLDGLRRVPLTTLLDAPFDGVAELVEEAARRALCDGAAPRVPRQPSHLRRGDEQKPRRDRPAPDNKRCIDIYNRNNPIATDDLRVLRLLPRQMSFAEIAVAVGSTAAEVKTRAIGIYRRLGAVSRAEAVDRARSLGLLQ